MRLTLCAIVKNEESSITGMLDSVRWVVDEVVLCDTGSTDNTEAVAKEWLSSWGNDYSYTHHSKSEEWKANPASFRFDEARNEALDYCTGDWILILDCDERLEESGAKEIRKMLSSMPEHVQLILPKMVMCRDDGEPYQQFDAERIVRGGKGIKFKGGMHNWVDVPEGKPRVAAPDIRILHTRASKSDAARSARSSQRVAMAEEIFKANIEADPNDRRSLFYLAGTYMDDGRYDEAIPIFERYLAVSDWPEERYQAAVLLSQLYARRGDLGKAREVISTRLGDNWRRAEGYVILGKIALARGRAEEAEWWFKAASLKPAPEVEPMFVEPDAHTWEPHYGLYQAYAKLGDCVKAIEHGRMAVEQGAPKPGEIVRFEKNHTLYKKEKIACLVDRGQMDFIAPLIEQWKADGRGVYVTDNHEDISDIPDIIWCEWAGDECVKLTHEPKKARIIVRVHGYELHSGLIDQVNWVNVDDVIFVADYLRDMAIEQCPEIAECCNVYVVPGGVEVEKFSVAEGKTGKRIAMACYGNQKKNFPLAFQILAKCPEDYELHIATEWQDHRLAMYCDHIIRELGIADRVFFHEWQTDLNSWYGDKDYYLSASQEESFHYALAEAMAAGLKPVIHNWISAKDFYLPEWIFNTVDEAVNMLNGRYTPEDYRQYAIVKLNVSQNKKRIERIINRPSVAFCGRPSSEYSMENKVIQAAESLGVRTDAPNDMVDAVIIMGIEPTLEPWMDGKKKVLWHAEQIVGSDEHAKMRREQVAPVVPLVDVVVTHSPHTVDTFKELGAKEVVCVPFVSKIPPFRKLEGVEKVYDVGFSGYVNERRQRILEELGKEFEVACFNDPDHEKVNLFYNQCRVVLNLHISDAPNTETRLGEARSAGAFIVDENDVQTMCLEIRSILDSGDWKIGSLAPRHTLKDQVEKVLEVAGV